MLMHMYACLCVLRVFALDVVLVCLLYGNLGFDVSLVCLLSGNLGLDVFCGMSSVWKSLNSGALWYVL